jgi:hypothetical protein
VTIRTFRWRPAPVPRQNLSMDKFEETFERIKIHGKDLAEKIRELIHEGNVRRIIVKDEHGHTFMEIPLTVASIGVVAAPIVAAVGAIAALVARFDIVIERTARPASPASPSSPEPPGETGGGPEGHEPRAS